MDNIFKKNNISKKDITKKILMATVAGCALISSGSALADNTQEVNGDVNIQNGDDIGYEWTANGKLTIDRNNAVLKGMQVGGNAGVIEFNGGKAATDGATATIGAYGRTAGGTLNVNFTENNQTLILDGSVAAGGGRNWTNAPTKNQYDAGFTIKAADAAHNDIIQIKARDGQKMTFKGTTFADTTRSTLKATTSADVTLTAEAKFANVEIANNESLKIQGKDFTVNAKSNAAGGAHPQSDQGLKLVGADSEAVFSSEGGADRAFTIENIVANAGEGKITLVANGNKLTWGGGHIAGNAQGAGKDLDANNQTQALGTVTFDFQTNNQIDLGGVKVITEKTVIKTKIAGIGQNIVLVNGTNLGVVKSELVDGSKVTLEYGDAEATVGAMELKGKGTLVVTGNKGGDGSYHANAKMGTVKFMKKDSSFVYQAGPEANALKFYDDAGKETNSPFRNAEEGFGIVSVGNAVADSVVKFDLAAKEDGKLKALNAVNLTLGHGSDLTVKGHVMANKAALDFGGQDKAFVVTTDGRDAKDGALQYNVGKTTFADADNDARKLTFTAANKGTDIEIRGKLVGDAKNAATKANVIFNIDEGRTITHYGSLTAIGDGAKNRSGINLNHADSVFHVSSEGTEAAQTYALPVIGNGGADKGVVKFTAGAGENETLTVTTDALYAGAHSLKEVEFTVKGENNLTFNSTKGNKTKVSADNLVISGEGTKGFAVITDLAKDSAIAKVTFKKDTKAGIRFTSTEAAGVTLDNATVEEGAEARFELKNVSFDNITAAKDNTASVELIKGKGGTIGSNKVAFKEIHLHTGYAAGILNSKYALKLEDGEHNIDDAKISGSVFAEKGDTTIKGDKASYNDVVFNVKGNKLTLDSKDSSISGDVKVNTKLTSNSQSQTGFKYGVVRDNTTAVNAGWVMKDTDVALKNVKNITISVETNDNLDGIRLEKAVEKDPSMIVNALFSNNLAGYNGTFTVETDHDYVHLNAERDAEGKYLAKVWIGATEKHKKEIAAMMEKDLPEGVAKDLAELYGAKIVDHNNWENEKGYNVLGKLTKEDKVKVVERLSVDGAVATKQAQKAVDASVGSAVSSLQSRMSEVEVPVAGPVSSGDDASKTGVWAGFFGGKATASKTKDSNEFNINTYGGSIGADMRVGENGVMGVAVSYADSDAKEKGAKKEDAKTTVQATTFAVYGSAKASDFMSLSGVAGIISGNAKTKSKILDSNATSKRDLLGFVGSVNANFHKDIAENVKLVPSAGISFSTVSLDGAKESVGEDRYSVIGTTTKKNTATKVTANLGAKVQTTFDILNDVKGHGELRLAAGYDVVQKLGKAESRLTGMKDAEGNFYAADLKKDAGRVSGKIGLGLGAKTGSCTFDVNYDMSIAKKFVGHQGSLKLRVDF